MDLIDGARWSVISIYTDFFKYGLTSNCNLVLYMLSVLSFLKTPIGKSDMPY